MAGLYLHIPFCEHKCVYCDFYSIAPEGDRGEYQSLVDRFVKSLVREIELVAASPPTRPAMYDTIFFGGGTPSLLHPSVIAMLLDGLRRLFPVADDAEVTLETNPGTVEATKLRAYRAAGINRLSIGIQSFHADDLAFLTRIHSADQASQCVRDAFAAGFDNVSCDLIFSLPHQTVDRWQYNLDRALSLEPTHISCYSLIVEPNTPLFRLVETKQVTMLDTEQDAELYERTMEFLASRGYEQYEVSNFARPGFRSRHNSGYWNHEPYIGFGPSAHSFGDGTRWWNIANISTYLERLQRDELPIAGREVLTPDQLQQERIFLGLRGEGLNLEAFRKQFGRDLLAEFRLTVEALVAEKMAMLDGHWLRLTPRGYLLCDEIAARFRWD